MAYSDWDRYKNDLVPISREMTNRWQRCFEIAKAASEHSDGKFPRDRMGAAIFSGSRLLSVGFNQYAKSRPGNIGLKKNGRTFLISIHAEQSALSKIKYRDYSSNKLICYIVRLNSVGDFTSSKPCNMCIDHLKNHGIKNVRFINESGNPEELILC